MATARIHPPVEAASEAQRLPWRLDQVLLAGVLVSLAVAVLSMGAVLPWSHFVLRSCAAGLFLVWAAAQAAQGRIGLARTSLYAPALAFIALGLAQLAFGFSAYPHDTLVELLNYISYGLLAFVMLQAMSGSDHGKLLAYTFTAFGLAVAVFALLQYFTSDGKLFWTVRVPAQALFFGPYVNHNHYAGLMELLIPFALVGALQTQLEFPSRMFFGFAAVVMGVSVVESGSRGGILALGGELVFLFALSRITRMKRGTALVLLLLLVAMAAMLALVADSAVTARLCSMRQPERADVAGWRMQLNRDSLAMVRSRPLLGWGLGTFPSVYPQFRSFYDDAPIQEAHDDYMQMLVETGMAGGVITLWFLFVVYREGWRNVGRGDASWARSTTTAAMIAVGGLLIHSASDFNLHIPANAAIFLVMCALVVCPIPSHARHRPTKGPGATSAEWGPSEPQLLAEEAQPKLRVVVRRF
jgi:O-antigen ligase